VSPNVPIPDPTDADASGAGEDGERDPDPGGATPGTCPRCGGGLSGIDARGARDVRALPCGCRVGHVRVQRVFGTEAGLAPELAVPPG